MQCLRNCCYESREERKRLSRSEAFGAQQRVGQIKQQTRGHEARQCVVEHHGRIPLFERASVTEEIPARFRAVRRHRCNRRRLRRSPGQGPTRQRPAWKSPLALAWCRKTHMNGRFPVEAMKCHSTHRFSRRRGLRRYRNLINTGALPRASLASHNIPIRKRCASSRYPIPTSLC